MTAAPAIDERLHRDVLAAAVTATVGADRVFDYGEVPGADGNAGSLPPIFVLLSIERTYVQPTKVGLASRSGWRASFRCVGRSADEARWARLRVTEAIDGLRFTIDGHESTPVTHESTTAIQLDDGRQSGLVTYTYTL